MWEDDVPILHEKTRMFHGFSDIVKCPVQITKVKFHTFPSGNNQI
jgi:hypothetical protein